MIVMPNWRNSFLFEGVFLFTTSFYAYIEGKQRDYAIII